MTPYALALSVLRDECVEVVGEEQDKCTQAKMEYITLDSMLVFSCIGAICGFGGILMSFGYLKRVIVTPALY